MSNVQGPFGARKPHAQKQPVTWADFLRGPVFLSLCLLGVVVVIVLGALVVTGTITGLAALLTGLASVLFGFAAVLRAMAKFRH